ncbi:MAG: peptidoglycan recognition protein family protein [Actinomycetota bacterium]|nr:peptidoglycan recognition protein family protein [Actinomycetota bacterium]
MLAADVPPRPAITQDPIAFDARRIAQTRQYADRHYGLDRARLLDPKVIVIHYTASSTYSSVFNTFDANVADVELGETPQVCSHYVIDARGTIYQLVSLKWICRHTVGLNYTAIGIEHVGTSAEQVLGNSRMMRASTRLVRWLRGSRGIALANVIGHNESLSSPYHRERVARLRRQTHGDFTRAEMRTYRARLTG